MRHFIIDEIDLVPNKEGVNRPNFPTIIAFLPIRTIQDIENGILIEEFLDPVLFKHFADRLVERFVFQPLLDRASTYYSKQRWQPLQSHSDCGSHYLQDSKTQDADACRVTGQARWRRTQFGHFT